MASPRRLLASLLLFLVVLSTMLDTANAVTRAQAFRAVRETQKRTQYKHMYLPVAAI